MDLSEKLFTYLKSKLKSFEKTTKKGAFLFTCPNIANHKFKAKSPTATIITGSDKISCLQCSWKGTFFDVIRLLEPDKNNYSDAQITEYLINTMHVDLYSELEQYKIYKWALVPIARNGKSPIEKDWTNITHYEKVDWIKWLNNSLNIGVRTGEVSGITVIDVDNKNNLTEEQKQIKVDLVTILNDTNTLEQNTPHGGKHYVFQYDKDIPQVVDIAGLKIDTRNDGGQILIQPSKIDNLSYTWLEAIDIKKIPENVKVKLLELMKVDVGRKEKMSQDLSNTNSGDNSIKVVVEGGRNDLLTSIGGILINKLSSEQTEFVLNIISRNFMNPPLPGFEIKNMLGSLAGYKENEDTTQEKLIFEYLKQMCNDVNAMDVVNSLKLSRAIVDKYLSKFVKDGKAIRLSRGRYKYREQVEWSDKFGKLGDIYKYKIPYFNEIQDFEEGDIILLGAKPGHGKTTTSINILKQMADQGVKPYYIYSESGGRYQKIASKIGLIEGSFYHSYHANPLSIEIEPNSFTVLDWLLVSEKENTDTVFKFFTEEMERKGGILLIMMQLKDNYDWYAPNMVNQFPALGARYIMDSEDGKIGHWQVDKLRDPKGNYRNYPISCEFDFESKILTKKDLI